MANASLQVWLDVFNKIYIWSLVIAAIAAVIVACTSFFIIQWQGKIQREKDAVVKQSVEEAKTTGATANKKAAEANERAENASRDAAKANEHAAVLLKANSELQLQIEKEKNARSAMLAQLQPRDFTKKQMDSFVAAIKGKLKEISVYTIADSEASSYGNMVIDGLQQAGVKVNWIRVPSNLIRLPGVATTGMTLYECPTHFSIGQVVMDAFVKIKHYDIFWSTPKDPIPNIPSPSLFIMLKPPAFQKYPAYLWPELEEKLHPLWDPK